MIKLPLGVTTPILVLVLVALVGCSAATGVLPFASLPEWSPASPAEDGLSQRQSAEDSPLIDRASVQPTKVRPGDTMVVTAEVSDSSGIKSVTANMGGIDTISLSLIEGSIYHGTWRGQWLVHDTKARQYVTKIVATNTLGRSSATDVLWRDPQTYERYHNEVYGKVTTTNTTWQDALTLTFTPNVAGDFLLFARADLDNTSTSTYTEAQIIYNSTVVNTMQFYPPTAGELKTFGSHAVVSFNATSYDLKMQYRTGDIAGTAGIQNYGINLISVSDYQYATGADNSTTLETWVDSATITFTPSTAGDYLVIASMEMAGDVLRGYLARVSHNGTDLGTIEREPITLNNYLYYTIIGQEQSLAAVQHVFKLQFMSKSGGGSSTSYIRRPRLSVIRLTDLGDVEYLESEVEDSTSSTTYILKQTPPTELAFDHTTYENNFRLLWGLLGGSSAVAGKLTYGAVFEDGSKIGESAIQPNNPGDRVPLWSGFHRFYSSANHTLQLKYMTASTIAYVKNVRLMPIRLDTLNPFSDSGHTTYSDNFTSLGDTVYIQGCFFSILDAYDDFHVAYYDGNGEQKKSEGVSSDANGVVNSWCTFSDYPLAAAGTWHAVIYMDPLPPSDNYTASDNTSIREAAFEVTAEAIPEFPTVMAGIIVAGLCFGIYYWMRKRRLAYVKA